MALSGHIPVLPDSDYDPFNFVYILTGAFGAIYVIGPLLVPRGEEQDFIRMSIREAAFYMWLVWVIIYLSQMYPITGLVFKNTTLLWLSYAWGNAGVQPVILPAKTTTTTVTTTTTTTTTTTITTRTTTTTTTTTKTTTTVAKTTTPIPTTTRPITTTTLDVWSGDSEPFYFKIFNKPGASRWDSDVNRQETNFKVPRNKVSSTKRTKHRIEFKQRRFCAACFVVNLRREFNTINPCYKVHVDSTWYYMRALDSRGQDECQSSYVGNIPGNTGNTWKPFWIEWDSDPVAGITTVTVGRGNETTPMLRITCKFLNIGEVDFQSTCESEVILTKGLELGPMFQNISEYGLRRVNENLRRINLKPRQIEEILRTYIDELDMTDSYKFYIARDEPIQIGVFMGRHLWREFFISLRLDQMIYEPQILIHIGKNYGKYCTISKNAVVVHSVKCDHLEWRRDSFLQFWVYYRNGQIAVKVGYNKPDPYSPFISWEDPQPFPIKLFAVRTLIGERIPVKVVDKKVVNFLQHYGLE